MVEARTKNWRKISAKKEDHRKREEKGETLVNSEKRPELPTRKSLQLKGKEKAASRKFSKLNEKGRGLNKGKAPIRSGFARATSGTEKEGRRQHRRKGKKGSVTWIPGEGERKRREETW